MSAFLARMKEIWALASLPLWLALCLILGGASSAGIAANAFLQAVALMVILVFGWRLTTSAGQQRWSEMRVRSDRAISGIMLLTACLILWIVVQLIPLPPSLWQNIGGRELIANGDRLLGLNGTYRPLSMQPNSTLISVGWVLVPLATFILTLTANLRMRRYTGYVIIAVAILSSTIGVVQLGQGPNSPAYFYDITNVGASVGFFANANHLATLYLCALVLCPWLFFNDNSRRGRKQAMLSMLGTILVVILVLNIVINRSLAGYILIVPAIAFVLMQHPAGREAIERLPISRRTFLFALAVLTLFFGWLMFGPFNKFTVGLTDPGLRLTYYAKSLEIAQDSFPFGIGLGAFRWVYTGYENPSEVTLTYLNHAHSDFIELLVEGGVVPILLIGGFSWWMVKQLRRTGDLAEWQMPLQLASAVIVGFVAAHSLVDYPARTAAIAALTAFAIANLACPPQRR